ncbi:hypothetical protein IBT54_000888 [Pantoea sp. S62]|nr:hypothetical protein [Pantoea sp. S62]
MLSMFSRILTICLMLLCLSGCVNDGGVRVIDTGCEWVRPIYVSNHDIDVMSVPTQRAILGHNETWEVNCNYQDGNR